MVRSEVVETTPAKRPRGRPRTGQTPKRNIRIGPIWDQAAALAAQRGETMTAVIARLLERYLAEHRLNG